VSPIQVVSADDTIRSAVEAWLAGGRLAPPEPLTLDILVAPPVQPDPNHHRFQQPELTIHSGGRDGAVTIAWQSWPATAEFRRDSPGAVVRLSPEAAAHIDECLRAFLPTTLIFLLRRAGWHHVHGATALDRRGRGWLLAGNSRAGKSTTVALLAARHWPVGTDDMAFLEQTESDGVLVHSFRSRLALRPGGEALLARTGGLPLEGRGKVGFWPEELGGSWVAAVRPTVLLFPRVGSATTTLDPVRPRDVLAELVRWSAWVALEPDLAQAHLDLLARLGAQATAYHIQLGRDLFDDPTLLERLIP
jgi:hypothetical protein